VNFCEAATLFSGRLKHRAVPLVGFFFWMWMKIHERALFAASVG
jgi:hypothetical protein